MCGVLQIHLHSSYAEGYHCHPPPYSDISGWHLETGPEVATLSLRLADDAPLSGTFTVASPQAPKIEATLLSLTAGLARRSAEEQSASL